MDEHADCSVVHCPAEIIDESGIPSGQLTGANNPERRSGYVFDYALRGSIVKSPTPLVRRIVFDECGLFDENLRQLYQNEDGRSVVNRLEEQYDPGVDGRVL